MSENTLELIEQRVAQLEEQIAQLRGFDEVEIMIEPVNDEFIPVYANKTDAGADLFASRTVVLAPGESVVMPTGIKVAIPAGYEIQVRPRSGISSKTTLRESNSPGTIDTGYRGEVGVILHNVANPHYPVASFKNPEAKVIYVDGSEAIETDLVFTCRSHDSYVGDYDLTEPGSIIIRKGDRIAQMVVNKIVHADFKLVNNIETIGENRGGGFGHSGV